MNPLALAGFNEAAAIWSSLLVDPVQVNLEIAFGPLDPGVLGSTGSAHLSDLYGNVANALAADATTLFDLSSVSSLPTSSALSFLTNSTDGTLVLDNNGSANNFALDLTRANARALGLVAASDSASDGSISFSTGFAWDFDASDGITPGTFDFVGVAAHEIGHALGFVSGVDLIDLTTGIGPAAPFDLDNYAVFSALDLFRFSDVSLALAPGLRDFSTGASSFFSIDGGITPIAPFEGGSFNGTGQQASHWQDSPISDPSIGIMDPTLAYGEIAYITGVDLIAFDVIGWDLNPALLVPESSSLGGLALLFAMALGPRRRRAAARSV